MPIFLYIVTGKKYDNIMNRPLIFPPLASNQICESRKNRRANPPGIG